MISSLSPYYIIMTLTYFILHKYHEAEPICSNPSLISVPKSPIAE